MNKNPGIQDERSVSLQDLKQNIQDLASRLDRADVRFRDLINSLADRFILFDREFIIVDINESYLAVSGKKRSDVINQSLMTFFPEFKQSRRYREFVSVFETGVPIQVEDYIHDERFGEVYESVQAFRVGDCLGILARDISDFKKMVLTLQENQATTHVLMNAGTDSAFLLDKEGVIIAVNDAGCRHLNRLQADILGRSIDSLAPESNHPIRKNWLQALRDHHRPVRYEIEFEGKCRAEQAYPIFSEKGDVDRIVLFSREVTEEKQLRKEQQNIEAHLRQIQKLETLGTLASGIAHDFNNILTPILGYTDLAIQHIDQPDRALTFLENVKLAGKRARELVRQILTFSRQVDQERRPVHAHTIVSEVIRLIRATLPLNIEFQHQVDLQCGVVLVDPSQIHQVIMNLCTNALHAMRSRGGRLSIKLTRFTPDDSFRLLYPNQMARMFAAICVSDTGHGMDQTVRERIFEPFFTTKQPGEGTGLGLSVAHGIIKNHQGEINVESTPGEGSTFSVYLPIVDSNVEIEMLREEASLRGSGHILFVDDEVIIGEMAMEALTQNGYTVTMQTSSRDALALFRNNPNAFDLVVTDLAMPYMNGTELAREMLKLNPELPIILITGFSETVVSEHTRRIGIRELLLKPLIPKDLFRAIRNILIKPTESLEK